MIHKSEMFRDIFKCSNCTRSFESTKSLLQHNRLDHELKGKITKHLTCTFCGLKFVTINSLQNHMMRCRSFKEQTYVCKDCGHFCKGRSVIVRHIVKENKQIGFGLINRYIKLDKNSHFKKTKSAFKNIMQMFELYPKDTFVEVSKLINFYKNDILKLLKSIIKILKSVKIQISIQCSFARHVGPIVTYTVAYFCTLQNMLNSNIDLNKYLNGVISYLDNAVENFENNGSGWKLIDIDRLDLSIILYIPFKAGNCSEELRKYFPDIIKKKAIISIENSKNDRCFLNCILCYIALKIHLQSDKKSTKIHLGRLSVLNKYLKYLNVKRLSFPVGLREIKFFEKDNSHLKIKINLYSYEFIDSFNQTFIPLYISKIKACHTINILTYKNHYFFIKNFNRLFGSKFGSFRKFCPNCITGFRNNDSLQIHLEICNKFKARKILMPKEKYYEFSDYRKLYRHEYLIFTDFESILVRENDKISKNTTVIEKHIECTYSLVAVNDKSEVIFKRVYTGQDCMDHFFKTLRLLCFNLISFLNDYIEMETLTEEQKYLIRQTNICILCEKSFENESDKRIDHDHLTGKFRSVLHNNCNLKYRIPNKIPIIFHNLTNYDEHFIIQSLKNNVINNISIIPQSFEKYKAFLIDNMKFLDSCQFLGQSLEQLTKNLVGSNYEFPIVNNVFKRSIKNDRQKELLLRKSVYMYEYMDSFDKFSETSLPPKNAFYTSLRQKHISDEEYDFAKDVWKEFGFKNLKEYTEFYCLLDTSLLADIFCKFRNTIHDTYKLDVCHYFSIPGLSWDAAMRSTKMRIELIQDPTIYQFLQLGIRGGVCGVNQRHAIANNINIDTFDSNKPNSFIINLDVNNLYGKCLNMYLPFKNFKFLNEDEYINIDWEHIKTNSEKGYILECDLYYPENLHDDHSDFPLCPLAGKVSNEELSAYQLNSIEKLKNIGYKRFPTPKLLLTLKNKKNYILHFKNLKLYMKLGLKITKVHKVLSFDQTTFKTIHYYEH